MWDKWGFVWDMGGGYRTNLNMVILAFYIFSHAQAIFQKIIDGEGLRVSLDVTAPTYGIKRVNDKNKI